MTVIQKLLELHPPAVADPAPRPPRVSPEQKKVAEALQDFWERQQRRKRARRDFQERHAARRASKERPSVIPGQTSRAETRMTLNALAMHQEIILRERQRDYIRTERDMGLPDRGDRKH